MTLHTPVHPRPVPHIGLDREWLGFIVMIAIATAFLLAMLWLPRLVAPQPAEMTEQEYLIEFRAGERDMR
jgi:hypothetical protein